MMAGTREESKKKLARLQKATKEGRHPVDVSRSKSKIPRVKPPEPRYGRWAASTAGEIGASFIPGGAAVKGARVLARGAQAGMKAARMARGAKKVTQTKEMLGRAKGATQTARQMIGKGKQSQMYKKVGESIKEGAKSQARKDWMGARRTLGKEAGKYPKSSRYMQARAELGDLRQRQMYDDIGKSIRKGTQTASGVKHVAQPVSKAAKEAFRARVAKPSQYAIPKKIQPPKASWGKTGEFKKLPVAKPKVRSVRRPTTTDIAVAAGSAAAMKRKGEKKGKQ